jgi:hypothetical protein
VDGAEDPDVRTEIAVALGQYPTPAVFQALVAALSQRELAVNVAAVDSLRALTGQNFGIDEDAWLGHFASTATPFASARTFVYPTFVRELDVWDHLLFWMPVTFESPDVPIGAEDDGRAAHRRTRDFGRRRRTRCGGGSAVVAMRRTRLSPCVDADGIHE